MLTGNSVHDQSGRLGTIYGRVYIMRKGRVPVNSQGQAIDFPPESVGRGDIICDLNLQPLRHRHNHPQKGHRNGRRH